MVLSAWAIPTDKSHRVLIHNFSFCRFCALRIWNWIFFSSFRIQSEFINREIKAECECAVPVAMQSVIGISHVHGKTLKRNKYIRSIDDTSCATSTIDAERVFNIFIRFSCCVVVVVVVAFISMENMKKSKFIFRIDRNARMRFFVTIFGLNIFYSFYWKWRMACHTHTLSALRHTQRIRDICVLQPIQDMKHCTLPYAARDHGTCIHRDLIDVSALH